MRYTVLAVLIYLMFCFCVIAGEGDPEIHFSKMKYRHDEHVIVQVKASGEVGIESNIKLQSFFRKQAFDHIPLGISDKWLGAVLDPGVLGGRRWGHMDRVSCI